MLVASKEIPWVPVLILLPFLAFNVLVGQLTSRALLKLKLNDSLGSLLSRDGPRRVEVAGVGDSQNGLVLCGGVNRPLLGHLKHVAFLHLVNILMQIKVYPWLLRKKVILA